MKFEKFDIKDMSYYKSSTNEDDKAILEIINGAISGVQSYLSSDAGREIYEKDLRDSAEALSDLLIASFHFHAYSRCLESLERVEKIKSFEYMSDYISGLRDEISSLIDSGLRKYKKKYEEAIDKIAEKYI